VAIVTGAGRGLGREIALELARRGARIVVADHGSGLHGSGTTELVAHWVADEIAALGGAAIANTASVAEEAGVRAIIGETIETFGRLDIIVNMAGLTDHTPFADETVARMRRSMDVMFFGSMMLALAAWPYMVSQGGGRILNACSSSLFGIAGYTNYISAKGALFGLTRSLGPEGAPHGIHVNAIAPAAATRMALNNPDLADRAEWMKTIFAPEFIVPTAIYLLHETCALNGEVLGCGGGAVSAWKFGETAGIVDRQAKAETIAERVGEIIDSEIRIYRTQADQAQYQRGEITEEVERQMRDQSRHL
jgi:NAD(P)-dependent dehydrogenase (short-subunit alcohol dehydrogenase family)